MSTLEEIYGDLDLIESGIEDIRAGRSPEQALDFISEYVEYVRNGVKQEFENDSEITTSDELDALESGAIVADPHGMPLKKENGKWRTLNGKRFDSWEILNETPLTLIYLPTHTNETSN